MARLRSLSLWVAAAVWPFPTWSQSLLDYNIIGPGGVQMPSPSCIYDPCACGYCPEGAPPSTGAQQTPPNLPVAPAPSDSPSVSRPSDSGESSMFLSFPRPEGPSIAKGTVDLERFQIVDICRIDPCACAYCPNTNENGASALEFSAPQMFQKSEISLATLERSGSFVDNDFSMCPDQRIRPWGLMREAFFFRERAHQCTDTVLELQQVNEVLSVADFPYLFGETLAEVRALYEAYASNCIQPLASVVDFQGGYSGNRDTSNVLRFSSKPGETERLLASVGRILTSNLNRPICSGALISVGDETRLLTAAHCLGLVAASVEDASVFTFEATWPGLTFETFSGQYYFFEIEGDVAEFSYDPFTEDLVMAPVSSSEDLAHVGIPLVSRVLDPWEPILIVGENPYLSAISSETTESGLRPLASTMSITLDPNCHISAASGGVLRYLCQTEFGMSGSPILVLRDGEFFVAGVHVNRVFNPGAISCEGGIAAGGANLGIALTQEK